MPVEMIAGSRRGFVGADPASGPPFAAEVIAETARIHERAGFDRVLIGYFSDAPTGSWSGARRRGDRAAEFPAGASAGFVAPPVAARKLATLDQLSGGRLAVHIIAAAATPIRPRRRLDRS